MVSPCCASLEEYPELHMYAHTCMFISASRSPVRSSWKLAPPPHISSSTLHDSLQSVNLELSPHDAISGMVTGGGRKEQEEGGIMRGGANRLEETWRSGVEEEESKYLATLSLPLSLSVSLPLTG